MEASARFGVLVSGVPGPSQYEMGHNAMGYDPINEQGLNVEGLLHMKNRTWERDNYGV